MNPAPLLMAIGGHEEEEDAQLDLLGPAVQLQAYRASFRSGLKRVTPKEMAYLLKIDADSLGQQVRLWNKRKHPSADAAFLLQYRDSQHAREAAEICGWILSKPPSLEPEEALRKLLDQSAKGFVSAEELSKVVAQTNFKKGGADR